VIPLQKGLENLLVEVELNSVIGCCDSLDIPVNVLILLDALNVLEERESEEVDEHGPACHYQANELPPNKLCCWKQTRSLEEEVGVVSALSIIQRCGRAFELRV
jgi:hypothetical protein